MLFTLGLGPTLLAACGADSAGKADSAGGSGGSASSGGSAAGGGIINQCGVAAPWPAETGQCKATSAPLITNFDDYAGTTPDSYTYYVNGMPPAADAVLGAILHVGDGSDMDGGTSVIATEMVVPGEDGAGYALQISNTNASHWGGLLMLYLPFGGCLDARKYGGLEFSLKGVSPSGRFGIALGMLDTIPTADHGLCEKQTASDCKDPTTELMLPPDPTTWTKVQVPWSAFTPGLGRGAACVPVTGQNIQRIVIQPFMNYPPPDYMFAPGAYTLAVDNVRFY